MRPSFRRMTISIEMYPLEKQSLIAECSEACQCVSLTLVDSEGWTLAFANR